MQERFDITINLIKKNGENFHFLRKLLDVYGSTVLVFSFFNKPSRGNSRNNVLAAYKLRFELMQDKDMTNDYIDLFHRLGKTKHSHICVSIFITGDGTFTIFSDFGIVEIIGALFVPDTPKEVPAFSHLFLNGLLLSRERSYKNDNDKRKSGVFIS